MDSSILLPLYVYPHPGAWDPLYAAITAHPNLQFLIIINPNSGPGNAPWWPNADYVREIPRLNAYPNVQLVGYVRATYCKRSINDVLQDVRTYATRPKDNSNAKLEIQGIFVDETVNLYSPHSKQYLDDIDRTVKTDTGIGGNKITIHNPGTAVNAELAIPGPDITVVVETSYEQFVAEEYQEWLQTSPYDRLRTCYMLHSVPKEKVENLTTTLREKAAYLFITSATVNFYESFQEPSWHEFVAAMVA
ncbi:Spherulation-specific family 4 [Phaeosphaeriaceae sp. PMI808]|nr:Spherulation-specific family 4 [Phaeosphaeriaceae sp. PMI808]